jgi:hypothetical protein
MTWVTSQNRRAEKEKPLTNQRFIGIMVEANGKKSLRDFL